MSGPGPWAITYPPPPPAPTQRSPYPFLTSTPASQILRPSATPGELGLFLLGIVFVDLSLILILLIGALSLILFLLGGALAGYVANRHWGQFPFTGRGVTGYVLLVYGFVLMAASAFFLVGVIPMVICYVVGWYLVTPKRPRAAPPPNVAAPALYPPAPLAFSAANAPAPPPPPMAYVAGPGPAFGVAPTGPNAYPGALPPPSPPPTAPPTSWSEPIVLPPPPPAPPPPSPPPLAVPAPPVVYAGSPSPACPACHAPTVYSPQYGRFYCASCYRWT
jgi:hypothetical protein